MLTIEQLLAIMPMAGLKRATLYLAPLNAAMAEFQINTPARVAAFLAQVGHESGQLRHVMEIASGKVYDDRADLGNTLPEARAIAAARRSTPGQFWKGHGVIQITGYTMHCEARDALGIDCVEDPLILCQPMQAARSAAWFWRSRKLNELADSGDFIRITRRINGGTNGLADRQALHLAAKGVLA